MDSNNNGYTASFGDVLLADFIALKLAGLVDWSWWIVFSPFWISWIVYLIMVFIIKVTK